MIKKYWWVPILLISAFYWFQWRPSQASKECMKTTREKIKTGTTVSAARLVFDFCMKDKGIN